MAIAKLVGAQRDFSSGELDESTKRADENPIVKTGGRQMANWRILTSRAMQNRPGRAALFMAAGRVEEIVMPGGALFFLVMSAGILNVYDANGLQHFGALTLQLTPGGAPVPIPWTQPNLGAIVWAQIGRAIYIAYADGFPSNVPQVLTFDGVSTWTLQPYAETVQPSGQKRTVFYRISPPGTTLLPSDTHGNINITFSTNILTPAMVGTRLQFCGRQLTITGFIDAQHGTATVNEPLPFGETLSYTTLTGAINIGDVVIGATTGAQGIVTGNASEQVLLFRNNSGYTNPSVGVGDTVIGGTSGTHATVIGSKYYLDGQAPQTFYIWLTVAITSGPGFVGGENVTGGAGTFAVNTVTTVVANAIIVQLIPNGNNIVAEFQGTETIAGPSGSFTLTGTVLTTPHAVADWDDEVMNFARGFPSSVFADQSRLGFANFPSVPSGIAWSAIGLPYDLFVGALPADAIFELAPDNSQVFYVIAGMESAEFVFSDRAIYYIPIGGPLGQNPLQPGSVSFNKLSDYGCLPNVQPRRAEQSIVYFKAGGTVVGAVQVPGAYFRPYIVDNISELHSHLFVGQQPLAIAIPSGSTQFAELYLYVLLANGSLVVGHYAMRQGLLEPGPEGKPAIGWQPWTGGGLVKWISARQSEVIFSTYYFGRSVVERLDDTNFLDAALLVNNLPATFAPPGGKGPLYVFPGPGQTVFVIDNVTRFMGIYQIDSNGFLVPQFFGGEDLTSSNLVAGQPWTAIFEPWTPEAPPGQSSRQRLLRRRVSYMVVRFSNSTGFVMARLFAGPITPSSPALGTVVNTRRIPTWNQGDDPTQPPPLREDAERWRPIGRSFDPRVAIIKDTPGPLMINELGIEVTI